MFFGSREASKNLVKRVTSTFSARKKKNADEPKDLRRSKSAGYTYESSRLHKKKPPGLKMNDDKKNDVNNKLQRKSNKILIGQSYDDCDSIWLSSECTSPSFFIEERSRLSVSFHFSVDENVVSWLSDLANSSQTLDGGNTGNHRGEDDKIKKGGRGRIPKDEKEDPIPSRKNSTTKNEEKVSKDQKRCNGSIKASPEKLCQDPPRPDCSADASKGSKVRFREPQGHVSRNNSDHKEKADLKKGGGDEPLFWPYDQKFDWTPDDILKHFIISPRKKQAKILAGASPRSMRVQLQTKKLDFKEGGKRKLVINSGIQEPDTPRSNMKKDDSNNKDIIGVNKNGMKRINSLPSRLKNCSKLSVKVVPLEIPEDIAKPNSGDKNIFSKPKHGRKCITFLEDDYALMKDQFSIESIIGLGEFNGREGIESDFNGDSLFPDDSL